jgi:hypothetical protein
MWRTTGGIVLGLVTWAVVVTLLNFGLRAALPDYHAAEATLDFTLAMKIGRLVEAALASIAAGAVTAWMAPEKRWAPWVVGLILFAAFVPEHIKLWASFPIWYHLTFLVTLAPLVALGGMLARNAKAGGPKPATAS